MKANGFEINWCMSKDLSDNILYQKWSTKTIGQVVAGKAQFITDIGSVTPNKDTVYILAFLMWLARIVDTLGGIS